MNKVLLPVFPKGKPSQLLEVGQVLLRQLGQAELILASIIRVPKALPLSYGTLKVASARRWLNTLVQDLGQVRQKTVVKVGHSFSGEISRLIEACEANFLILSEKFLLPKEFDLLRQKHPETHIIAVREARQHDPKFQSVILISGAGQNSLAQHLAVGLKDWFNASLGLWLVEQDKKPLLSILEFQPEVKLLKKEEINQKIKALNSSLIILDASLANEMQTVKPAKSTSILTVKEGQTPAVTFDFGFERFGYWHLPEEKILEKVDRWFAENTFDCDEFADLAGLLELKKRQKVKISLVLPTLNEEATIGQILDIAINSLPGLLDETVVIDSGSKDKTVQIAKSFGVPVFVHQKVQPKYGAYSGKGEALWKSLFVTQGDIIIWVDTDISNFNPAFIYGLAGPLLKYPELQYVKGFYYRPLKTEAGWQMTGGGRVTELTARPLINLFFPALSGLVQPLSGEYAGRRTLLEQLTFYTGYGVEIGLLLDILNKFGLDVIGQVDLKQRVHRNQPLENLSKMAFAIIQVVLDFLEEAQHVKLRQQLNRRLNLIKRGSNRFHLEPEQIQDLKRPPVAKFKGQLEYLPPV